MIGTVLAWIGFGLLAGLLVLLILDVINFMNDDNVTLS